MVTKLFISGYPLEMAEMELAQLVGPFGDIITIKIVRDNLTKKSKSYAFIEMASRKAADLVIEELDGKLMGDKELTVSIREDEPTKPAQVYKKVERQGGNVKKKRPRLSR